MGSVWSSCVLYLVQSGRPKDRLECWWTRLWRRHELVSDHCDHRRSCGDLDPFESLSGLTI